MYLFWQRVNAPELLRLYINYDLLIEAVTLAVEYIQAVLGNGKEYFGLKVNTGKNEFCPLFNLVSEENQF